MKGVKMPVYVALSKLTEEGSKTIKNNPERIKAVNQDVEAMGVKILSQYALLGQYDFINILEAPDNDTIVRMSVEIGSRGSVQMQTMPAVSIDDLIADLKG
ncbi:MAG: GYD domain-containing protein [Thermoleophilia bacterium]